MRGEEVLQQWKPRGLSLIRDYDKTTRDKRRAADVEATKSILASIGPIRTIASDSLSKDERLQQFIRLWKSYPTTQVSDSCSGRWMEYANYLFVASYVFLDIDSSRYECSLTFVFYYCLWYSVSGQICCEISSLGPCCHFGREIVRSFFLVIAALYLTSLMSS